MARTKKPADATKVSYTPAEKAQIALTPSLNGASVVQTFQNNLMGEDTAFEGLVSGLLKTFGEVRAGDLHTLESMLVAQATALQTMFASLARRAAHQDGLRQYEAFMGLALKAQSQSRATISALVDLKYPRQATFVRQANIAHGAQQVNNGTAPAEPVARAEESKSVQNKLLEADHGQLGSGLDTRAQAAPARSHSAVAAVVEVHRADQR